MRVLLVSIISILMSGCNIWYYETQADSLGECNEKYIEKCRHLGLDYQVCESD